jgi:hypothetical protein
MRFCAPLAHSHLSPLSPGLPRPVRSAFRFSQPLSGLLLKWRRGLVSCPLHSWGLPFRAFSSVVVPAPRQNKRPPPPIVGRHTSSLKAGHRLSSTPKDTRNAKTDGSWSTFLHPSSFTSCGVLPHTSGRCSHGLWLMPSRAYYRMAPTRASSSHAIMPALLRM